MNDRESILPTFAEMDAHASKIDKLEILLLQRERDELRKQLQDASQAQGTVSRLEQTMQKLLQSGRYSI
jgi:hypothetical protein